MNKIATTLTAAFANLMLLSGAASATELTLSNLPNMSGEYEPMVVVVTSPNGAAVEMALAADDLVAVNINNNHRGEPTSVTFAGPNSAFETVVAPGEALAIDIIRGDREVAAIQLGNGDELGLDIATTERMAETDVLVIGKRDIGTGASVVAVNINNTHRPMEASPIAVNINNSHRVAANGDLVSVQIDHNHRVAGDATIAVQIDHNHRVVSTGELVSVQIDHNHRVYGGPGQVEMTATEGVVELSVSMEPAE